MNRKILICYVTIRPSSSLNVLNIFFTINISFFAYYFIKLVFKSMICFEGIYQEFSTNFHYNDKPIGLTLINSSKLTKFLNSHLYLIKL